MDTYEKKYNEAMLRADEAVQKGCLDKNIFDIIFPPEESEDERIRKWILEKVQGYADSGIPCSDEIQMANKALAWLEKQKEQKPVVTHGETYHVDTLGTQQVIAGKMPQQPVEWSEEDEKMKERLITRLNWITHNTRTDGTSPNITFFDEIDWLKSLRPSWKPSKEQLNALNFAITYFTHETNYKNPTYLRDLYDDLLKLK